MMLLKVLFVAGLVAGFGVLQWRLVVSIERDQRRRVFERRLRDATAAFMAVTPAVNAQFRALSYEVLVATMAAERLAATLLRPMDLRRIT